MLTHYSCCQLITSASHISQLARSTPTLSNLSSCCCLFNYESPSALVQSCHLVACPLHPLHQRPVFTRCISFSISSDYRSQKSHQPPPPVSGLLLRAVTLDYKTSLSKPFWHNSGCIPHRIRILLISFFVSTAAALTKSIRLNAVCINLGILLCYHFGSLARTSVAVYSMQFVRKEKIEIHPRRWDQHPYICL